MKPNYYITNKELKEAYVVYHETGVITNEMGRLMELLVNKIGTHKSISGYTYLDEMKRNAVTRLVSKVHMVDSSRENILNYWTTIVWNSFKHTLNLEKRQRNIKDALKEENALEPSHGYDETRRKELGLDNEDDETLDSEVIVTKIDK